MIESFFFASKVVSILKEQRTVRILESEWFFQKGPKQRSIARTKLENTFYTKEFLKFWVFGKDTRERGYLTNLVEGTLDQLQSEGLVEEKSNPSGIR